MQIVFDKVHGNGEIHLDVLKAICGDVSDKSMLDLGCGFAAQTRQLGFRSRTYVDIVERDLAEEMQYFLNCDILSKEYYRKEKYDVSILLDAIEHFHKDAGDYILSVMETQSKKQIIFTPLGDYLIESVPTSNPDSHKSGWLPDNLQGWATIVFPDYHPTLNVGAFFAWKCDDLENDFEKVQNELKNKSWTK